MSPGRTAGPEVSVLRVQPLGVRMGDCELQLPGILSSHDFVVLEGTVSAEPRL